MNAISASLTAPLQSPGMAPSPERPTDPSRAGNLERRPVNASEPIRREIGDSRQRPEPGPSELVVREGEWLDAQVAQLLERAGDDRQSGGDGREGQFAGAPDAAERAGSGSTLGFADWRSALSYWESIEPQRVPTESLPAPVAAYREVEAGPAPTLGFSASA